MVYGPCIPDLVVTGYAVLDWVTFFYSFLIFFLQLKKMSNSKPTAAPSEPLESVEQAPILNESNREETKTKHLMAKSATKIDEGLTKGFPDEGNVESQSNAKRGKKRKFPSRVEISKPR